MTSRHDTSGHDTPRVEELLRLCKQIVLSCKRQRAYSLGHKLEIARSLSDISIKGSQSEHSQGKVEHCVYVHGPWPVVRILWIHDTCDIRLPSAVSMSYSVSPSHSLRIDIEWCGNDIQLIPSEKIRDSVDVEVCRAVSKALSNHACTVQTRRPVDAQDPDGFTELHHAVMEDSFGTVRHLLQCGACSLLRDKKGRRPLDLARERSANVYITQLLEQHTTSSLLHP